MPKVLAPIVYFVTIFVLGGMAIIAIETLCGNEIEWMNMFTSSLMGAIVTALAMSLFRLVVKK